MISIESAFYAVVYLVIGGVIFWLLWWLVNYLGLPEPFRKVATVILAVLAVLVCVGVSLSVATGRPLFVR